MLDLTKFLRKYPSASPHYFRSRSSDVNNIERDSSERDASPVTKSPTDGASTEQNDMNDEITWSNIHNIGLRIIEGCEISYIDSTNKLKDVIEGCSSSDVKNNLFKLTVLLSFMQYNNLRNNMLHNNMLHNNMLHNNMLHNNMLHNNMVLNVQLVLDYLNTQSIQGISFDKKIAWHFIFIAHHVGDFYTPLNQSAKQIPKRTKEFITNVLEIDGGIIKNVEDKLNNYVWDKCCACKSLKQMIDELENIFTVPKVTTHGEVLIYNNYFSEITTPITIPGRKTSQDLSITPREVVSNAAVISSSEGDVGTLGHNKFSISSETSTSCPMANKNNPNYTKNFFKGFSGDSSSNVDGELLPGDEIYNITPENTVLNVFPD